MHVRLSILCYICNLSHVAGGMPRDELFGRFYATLDQINFFTSSPGAVEDSDQIVKATWFFNEAIVVRSFSHILCHYTCLLHMHE